MNLYLCRAQDLAHELTGLWDDMAAMDDRGATGEPETPSPAQPQSRGEAAEARRLASARWDALLARIRAVPGLEGFWESPSADSLLPAADDGPVIIITTDRERCDALILDERGERLIRVVALTGLTDQEARQRANGFREALANAYQWAEAGQAQLDMRQTLEWLWDVVADPVLQALGHVSPPGMDQPWPRVYWCPTGPLGTLPLHAAGRRSSDDGHAVLDRVVSSYTPTVRALAHLRDRSHRAASGLSRTDTLIVAVPDAPGASPLPGVEAEVETLRSLLPGASVLTGPTATRDAVLAAMPRYPLAHLAPRDDQPGIPRLQPAHPLRPRQRPLTVAQIRRQRLPEAGLAYLSACSTGKHTPRLVDESVHITSAFLLAGTPKWSAPCGISPTSPPTTWPPTSMDT
jgi:CHAT domain-containing protein